MSKREAVYTIIQQSFVPEMLNTIHLRKNVTTSVESLRDALGISRSTADKTFNLLNGKEGVCPLIRKEGQRTLIINDAGFFLGISIGTKYVRIVLLGLGLEPVELESIYPREQVKSDFSNCQEQQNRKNEAELPRFVDEEEEKNPFSYAIELPQGNERKLEEIRATVRTVIKPFLEKAENDDSFPLLGIGFSVTGPVDYEQMMWRTAPRVSDLHNITISDLVGYSLKAKIDDMGLFLSIDNNAKAAAVSEYDRLVQNANGQYSEDLSLIYIGSGIGLASIVDRKLFRGGGNLSELGHVELMIGDDPKNTKTLEEIIWKKSSDKTYLWPDMDQLKEVLPYVLKLISCMMGTRRFILVGHNITTNADLVNELMDQRNRFTIPSLNASLNAESSRMVPYTAAIGAAMESYHTMCKYDPLINAQNRTNLASEISWERV